VFVATFAQEVSLLQDWTDDRGLLDQATRQAFRATPQDGTAIYDALVWACQNKLSGSTQRKALIVVSNAPDNASYRTLAETKEIVQCSDAIVYWVAPWTGRGAEPFPGIRTAQEFTAETGGIAYSADDKRSLPLLFAASPSCSATFTPSGITLATRLAMEGSTRSQSSARGRR